MKKLLTIIIVSICLSACLSTPNVVRQQYAFNVITPRTKSKIHAKKILNIANTTISPNFSGISFVYRRTDSQYLSDFYNVFMTPPAMQIQNALAYYLNQSGLFLHVGINSGMVSPDYTLTTNILELYADYRDTAHPKAVMAIRFVFLKSSSKIIFNKVYRQATLLQEKDSDSLMNGWNQDLTNILKQLARDIRQHTAVV